MFYKNSEKLRPDHSISTSRATPIVSKICQVVLKPLDNVFMVWICNIQPETFDKSMFACSKNSSMCDSGQKVSSENGPKWLYLLWTLLGQSVESNPNCLTYSKRCHLWWKIRLGVLSFQRNNKWHHKSENRKGEGRPLF